MNIERQVQQRSMFAFWSGDGRISGSAPGMLVGLEHRQRVGVRVAPLLRLAEAAVVAVADGLRSTVVSE